jgi:hypothetical protein
MGRIERTTMFYILNEYGAVVRTATILPNADALRSAGYTVIESELNVDIENIDVKGFPSKTVISEKPNIVLPKIVLATTAHDSDGDGVPEISADGKSKATLKVSLLDTKGAAMKKSIEVGFRVTAGAISQRSVKTDSGKATVYLTSSHETVSAIVFAFAEGFTPATLAFEFVPMKLTRGSI